MSDSPRPAQTRRRKRCSDCDELFPPDEVIDGLCEECDSHYTYCSICDERQHEDSACRHVFSCEPTAWEWYGAGSNEYDWHYHKESFLAVLDRTGLAELLRIAIEADTLGTQYYGSMIGPFSYFCRLKHPEAEFSCDYGRRFTDGLTDDLEHDMAIGVGWLDSLQYGDSPVRDRARALTLTWIDEWRADPMRRIGAGIGIPAATVVNWSEWRTDYPDRTIRTLAVGYGIAAKETFCRRERSL